MKQRLLLSILSILALATFALPRLPLNGGATAELFAWIWLAFCLVAFGGNVSAFLYGRRREPGSAEQKYEEETKHRRHGRGTGI